MARLVQSLVFGSTFNRNLENVTLLSITQCLTFGVTLNRNLEHAVLPGNTQSSTVGAMFNLNLMNVTPPNDVQSLPPGVRLDAFRGSCNTVYVDLIVGSMPIALGVAVT